MTNVAALAEAKLRESGLTLALAAQADMECVASARTLGDYPDLPGLVLHYPVGINGTGTWHKERSPFHRVRFLGPLPAKQAKYLQPKGSGTQVYCSPLIDWQALLESDEPLFITEGELKATAVIAHTGFACVGLGGVTMWQKNGALHPSLSTLAEGRAAVVLFDADPATGDGYFNVRRQLVSLLMALQTVATDVRWLDPRTVAPEAYRLGTKFAVDDAIAHLASQPRRASWIRDHFSEVVANHAHKPDLLGDALLLIGEELAYDRATSRYYLFKEGRWLRTEDATQHYRPLHVADAEGKRKSAFALWASNPFRAEFRRVYYNPTAPSGRDESGVFNRWTPTPIEPKKGPTGKWVELLRDIAGGDKDCAEYLEKWLAVHVQKHRKLLSTVYLSGPPGCGKTSVHTVLGEILLNDEDARAWTAKTGAYHHPGYAKMSPEQLSKSRFNGGITEVQLLVCDEAMIGDHQKAAAETLKTLITDPYQQVERKYMDPQQIRFYANLLFTGNDPSGLRFFNLEEDRRFLVLAAENKLGKAWLRDFWTWVREEGGREAILHRLQAIDLEGWDEREIPDTALKLDLIEIGSSEFESWFNEKFGADGSLRESNAKLFDDRDAPELWRVQDVQELYKAETGRTASSQQVGVLFRRRPWITRVAINAQHKPSPVKKLLRRAHIYAFANATKWRRMRPAKIAAQWEQEHFPRLPGMEG